MSNISSNADINDSQDPIQLMDLPDRPSEMDLLDYIVLNICGNVDKKKVYFKGAYMLTNILKTESRMTHDVDMSVVDKEIADEINRVLTLIGERLLSAGVISKFEVREMLPKRSGGIWTWHINNAGQEAGYVGVDISYSDTDLGVVNYSIAGSELYGFSVSRMLADKIMASQGRKIWRRMKDFFDIYVITSSTLVTIDFYEIVNCLRAREFTIDPDTYPFSEEKFSGLKVAWERNTFTTSLADVRIDYPFHDVIKMYDSFVPPILEAYKTGNPFLKLHWFRAERCWREDKWKER